MPLGCRSSIGALAGLAFALALPVAATACTPEEYMSPEDRGSGRYDTTPPDYYSGSDAPHTHGDATAGSSDTEPLEYGLGSSGERGASRGERKPSGRSDGADNPSRRSTPMPANPAPAAAPAPVTTVAQPTVMATQPAAVAAAAARAAEAARAAARREAAAKERAAARERADQALAVERRQKWAQKRSDRPSLTLAPARPEMSAATPAPDERGSSRTWLVALAAGLALLAALAGGTARRRGGTAVAAPGLDAEMEAELQEMLAEEHARRAGAALE